MVAPIEKWHEAGVKALTVQPKPDIHFLGVHIKEAINIIKRVKLTNA